MTAIDERSPSAAAQPSGRVEQVREPLTYGDGSRHSFFRDIILAQLRRDAGAVSRLDRNRVEQAAERASIDAANDARFGSTMSNLEARATTSALGSGGEFDVPISLLNLFASGARAGRTLGDLVNQVPLPAGVSSIHIPRMTTGSQAMLNVDTQAVTQQDLVTTDVTAPVITIAGELDVSQQIFDMAPAGFDAYAFSDLTRAYNRQLDQQLLVGSGVNGQALGVTNVPGINVISGTAASTFPALWPLLGQAAAQVGNNRFLPPEVFLMAPRRWFWIASSLDSSLRPISSPGNGAPQPSQLTPAGGANPIGPLLGLPGYFDSALNTGLNPDSVLALRPSDMYLFEGPQRLIVAPNPNSGTLQIRLSLHRYAAFVPHRYPTGISVVSGLPAPAGF